MNALRNLVKGKPTENPGTPPSQPTQPQPQPPSPLKSSLGASQGNEDEPKVELKDDQVQTEDRKKLFSKLTGLIGKDIVSLLSLPVSMFEPASVLQTQVEPLRHADLLFKVHSSIKIYIV